VIRRVLVKISNSDVVHNLRGFEFVVFARGLGCGIYSLLLDDGWNGLGRGGGEGLFRLRSLGLGCRNRRRRRRRIGIGPISGFLWCGGGWFLDGDFLGDGSRFWMVGGKLCFVRLISRVM
jgi:hypothetical protein